MVAFPVLCVAAVIVAVRIGLREANRDESDRAGVIPRVRVHRGRRARPRPDRFIPCDAVSRWRETVRWGLARAAHLAHAGFVALGVASLLVMLLSLAAALAR